MRLMKAVIFLALCFTALHAEFDPSRFNFGADWEYPSKNGKIDELKYVLDYWTIWIWEDEFISFWHGAMIDTCRKYNQTPVFYGYLIAGLSGLGDADQGGRLDSEGGGWIRSNINKVVSTYEAYASRIASEYGTSKPVIWLMEPDFSQYCDGDGNDLSKSEAADVMKKLIGAVKKYLPNAYFSMDISPWDNNISSYYSNFDMSLISFLSNSGGRTQAGSDRIRSDANNNVTWAGASSAAGGLCIIADCGYGVGGKPTGHASDWDNIDNIKNRMKDGVLAITHKDPAVGWANTVKSLKTSLSGVSTKCSGMKFEMKYSLDTKSTSGGKVTKSPDALAYTSGQTVTVTAQPDNGYKFVGWTGDTTGSSPTLTFTMKKDYEIKANFVDKNALAQYSLTVNVTGSGVLKLDPDQLMYDSGTVVTVEAFVIDGTFTKWGGEFAGKPTDMNPLEIVMTGNKTVSAEFTGADVHQVNLVKNGSFNEGDADWTFGAYEDAKAEGGADDKEFKVTLQSTGTEDWQIQLMQPGITLEQGKQYVWSFYGYSEGGETSIKANIGMPVDPFTSYSKTKTIALTETREKFEYTFTMRSASTDEARIEFNGGKCTASWVIDEVELKEELVLGAKTTPPQLKPAPALVTDSQNERVTISWYDHAGRLLQTVSGDRRILSARNTMHFTGSAIAVVNIGGRRAVEKTVNLAR